MESDDKKGAASGLRMFALEAQERVTDYGRSDGYASSAHIGPSSIAGNQNEPADKCQIDRVEGVEERGHVQAIYGRVEWRCGPINGASGYAEPR